MHKGGLEEEGFCIIQMSIIHVVWMKGWGRSRMIKFAGKEEEEGEEGCIMWLNNFWPK